MNRETAKKIVDQYQGRSDVRSFVKPSHLEELSPLHEVYIDVVVVRKDEFHELEGGKTYMPRKETLDKFAAAAGVSYNEQSERTWKEGDSCYVGRSQAMIMGPDGKMIMGDVCEYEFDADVRTEEAKLNGKADWSNKDAGGRPGKRELTERDIQAERIQFLKVGRQRANTGARNRATVSILGMSTGFKGLFDKNDPPTATRTFLFSRIIVNAKNEMVMNAMLANLAGNTQALYGPKAIAAPAQAPADMTRDVTPKGTDPNVGADIPFDFTPAAAPTEDPEVEQHAQAILLWFQADTTPQAIKDSIQKLIDRGESRKEILKEILGLLKLIEAKKPGNIVSAIAAKIADPNATAADLANIRNVIANAMRGGSK